MRIVESTRSVWWRATLEDHPDGVLVRVYRKLNGDDTSPMKRESEHVLGCPMHVALDRMQELLNQLAPPHWRS
jgi:hypothetical protein